VDGEDGEVDAEGEGDEDGDVSLGVGVPLSCDAFDPPLPFPEGARCADDRALPGPDSSEEVWASLGVGEDVVGVAVGRGEAAASGRMPGDAVPGAAVTDRCRPEPAEGASERSAREDEERCPSDRCCDGTVRSRFCSAAEPRGVSSGAVAACARSPEDRSSEATVRPPPTSA